MEGEGQSTFERRLTELRHELRTPVGHMIGYAELIDEELGDEGQKAYRHDLAAIMPLARRCLR